MSKRISVALTSALLTAGLMLGACGSPANNSATSGDAAQSSSATETASAQSTAAPAKVDVSKAIVGDWKTASVDMNGVLMMGDMTSVLGEGGGFALSFDAAGTGTFGFSEESVKFDWKAKDDTTVTLTFEDTGEGELGIESMDVTYSPELETVTMDITLDGASSVITFTADGTLASYKPIDLSKAEKVTSLDKIAGTWNMSGFGTSGVLAIGKPDAIAEMMGSAYSPILVIAADGNTTDGAGENMGTISVGDDGATLTQASVTIATFKLNDDSLIMDMSEYAGSETFVIYSK